MNLLLLLIALELRWADVPPAGHHVPRPVVTERARGDYGRARRSFRAPGSFFR